LKLRPYQQEAIDETYKYWQNGGGNGLISVPTGGGKSLIMAQLIRDIVDQWGARVLVLTHVKELIKQDYEELKTIWPDAPAGMYSAGLNERDMHSPIIFAGIQSIEKRVHKMDPPPEIVIVDEAHLIPNTSTTRYRRAFSTLHAMYPHLKILGLTATPYRLDSGYLHKGDKALFNDIVYEVDVVHLIDNGWLSPVVSKGAVSKIDTAGIKHTGGEFNAGQLQVRAMDATAGAVKEIEQYGLNRKKWLIFASGVDHAQQIQSLLSVKSEIVTGKTKKHERDDIVHRYKAGRIKVLVNVGVFTTGFNVRDVDMIAILRATESPSLYVQIVGRGMRTHPGKNDCLVLDFGGNVERHGPIDAVQVKQPGEKEGEGIAPAKECPECMSIIHASFRECPDCGYQFPDPEIRIARSAGRESILSNQDSGPVVMDCQQTEYFVHIKPGKPESVRIEFSCGLQVIKHWIFPEVKSDRAYYFYSRWCQKAGIEPPYPKTAREFVGNYAPQFDKIKAVKNGKYWQVKNARLSGQ
jgi:DNA repair protein RadD